MKRAPRACVALLVAASGVLPACGRTTKPLPSRAEPVPEAASVPAPAPGDEMRAAIEKVAAYFGRREMRGDEGWVVVQAATALGPEFAAWAATRLTVSSSVQEPPDAGPMDIGAAEARFWGLRKLGEKTVPPLSLPQSGPVTAPPTEVTDADLESIVRLMTKAISCRRAPPSGRGEVLADTREPGHSYVLTHQLLALMLAYDQGCLDAAAVDAPRRKLAEALWREQAADGAQVHDLAFERMMALCYAGVCDWLEPSWIDALVRAQSEAGDWGNRDLHVNAGASATESHTAALAFYTLARTWRTRFPGAAPPRPPAGG